MIKLVTEIKLNSGSPDDGSKRSVYYSSIKLLKP